MSYLAFKSEYDKYPETVIDGFDNSAWNGWLSVGAILKAEMKNKRVLVVDCYPGVNEQELCKNLYQSVEPKVIIRSEDIFYNGDELTDRMGFFLTEDRVRGVMYHGTVKDFIDNERLQNAKRKVREASGIVLVYGFAASLITEGDVLVYADMARWEIQLRYRKGMPNYKQKNYNEDILKKYKRVFFVEWRIADKHKKTLYDRMDFYLDTNTENSPNMVSGKVFFDGS